MKRNTFLGTAAFAVVGLTLLLAAGARASDDGMTKSLVEYFRRKANIPPTMQVEVKDLKASKIKGAKTGTLSFGGRSTPFTVSDDGHYAFFGELEDLTVDPFAAVMKKISLKDVASKGPANAKVTIVEYSDFQCPYCSRGYQVMESQVLKEYGDKVRFIYKNFPLPMHPWAEPAAIATICVRQQKPEAFWKLYDYYFQNQRDITPQNLKDKSLEVLKDSGVDAAKFSDCLDNKKTADLVKAEQTEGGSVGVNGTPAFIINGRLVSGAQPFESFKAIIDDELARAGTK
ncbi:MAG: DsbA family protein [Candidatus Binatia bacterium]